MATLRLFGDVPDEDARRVLDAARRRSFSRGEIVFHEGDPGDALHVVEEGRFAVRTTTPAGDVALLAVLSPGDIFGELALLRPDGRRTATIVSLDRGRTLEVGRSDLDALRRANPGVNEVLLSIVAEKVGRYTGQLLEALYLPAELRVLRRLVELCDVYDGERVPVTQESLAQLAGTSRATVNRVLRQERTRGTLDLNRGGITVLDADSIRGRAKIPG